MLKTGRSLLSIAVAHGFMYAIGGQIDNSPLASVEKYDAKKNVWLEVSPMFEPRSSAAVAVLNGDIVVIGGATKCNSAETASVERFDGTTWTKV